MLRYINRVVSKSVAVLIAVLCCLTVPPQGHAAPPDKAAAPALRVLLVGNSYTKFNMLPVLLERIARNVPGGPKVRVDAVAHGGYTLRRHWLKSQAKQRIRFGRYTHVVLQGHSMRPIDKTEEMAEYVGRFADLASQQGARVILYETWARRADARLYRERADIASPADMQQRVTGTYQRLAASNDARLAPVGSLFMESIAARPDLNLYRNDAAHPSIRGSYLAACALYAAITGLDPAQTTYTPWGLDESEAQVLRTLSGAHLHAPVESSEMAAAPAGAQSSPAN